MRTTYWNWPRWWGLEAWCLERVFECFISVFSYTELHRWHRARLPVCLLRSWGRCHRSRCWSWWWWPSRVSGGECRTSCPARPSLERSPAQRRWASPYWQSYSAVTVPCDCSSRWCPASSDLWYVSTAWKSGGSWGSWRSAQPWRYTPRSTERTAGWESGRQRMGGFQGGRLHLEMREWIQTTKENVRGLCKIKMSTFEGETANLIRNSRVNQPTKIASVDRKK